MGCVWLIGSVLYPLLVEKYTSIALIKNKNASGEVTVQLPTGEKTQIDRIADEASQTVSTKTTSFFNVFKEAFSNNQPKKEVIYQKDTTTGVYKIQ